MIKFSLLWRFGLVAAEEVLFLCEKRWVTAKLVGLAKEEGEMRSVMVASEDDILGVDWRSLAQGRPWGWMIQQGE